MNEQDTVREVPAAALRFGLGICEFGDNGEDAKSAPIRMVARSGKPLHHWYWGKVAHDLSGMHLHKSRLPVDYCHEWNEVLGYLNRFEREPGEDGVPNLVCYGALTPFGEADRASEVIHKARSGVPYEASISFGGEGIVIEEVGEGATVQVNGYDFEGPGVVIRQWPLRGVAVCPYGADQNTASELSEKDRTVQITVLSQERAMSDEQPVEAEGNEAVEADAASNDTPVEGADTPPVEADHTPDEQDGEADDSAVEAPADSDAAMETPDAEAEDDSAVEADGDTDADGSDGDAELAAGPAECKRFIEAFGPIGAQWYAEGLPFTEARDRQVEHLSAENAELRKRLEDRGEKEPLSFSEDPTGGGEDSLAGRDPKNLTNKLGRNLARVAGGIRIAPPTKR